MSKQRYANQIVLEIIRLHASQRRMSSILDKLLESVSDLAFDVHGIFVIEAMVLCSDRHREGVPLQT